MELRRSDATITVLKSQVPLYLQRGDFFKSLIGDEDEPISIPANTFKQTTAIENEEDLKLLLSSLRFWCVEDISQEVIVFVLSSSATSMCDEVLKSFSNDFPYIKALSKMRPLRNEKRAIEAILSGIMDLVVYFKDTCCSLRFACRVAAAAGHVEVLQYLHENGIKLDKTTFTNAIEARKLDCVKYLRSQNVPWPPDALFHSLKLNSLDCARYAYSCGCQWETIATAKFTLATDDRYLERLEVAIQCGFPLDVSVTTAAAEYGALLCLQVLHNAGCNWDEKACTQAAMKGNLLCLQYLHENGCPWNSNLVLSALYQNTSEVAACISYALSHGSPLPDNACHFAAQHGSDLVLKCLHEAGAPWGMQTSAASVKNGNLSCLQYALENGCTWDNNLCSEAAGWGHLDCLQYLHEKGFPWDEQTVLKSCGKKIHCMCSVCAEPRLSCV